MNPEVEALKNRGNGYFQKGNYSDAIYYYTAATIIDPNHVISLGNRSACFLGKTTIKALQVLMRLALPNILL